MKTWTITGFDRCVFIKPRREYDEISNVNGQRWRRNSLLKECWRGQRMMCPNCYTRGDLKVVCGVNHCCGKSVKKSLLHNFIRNSYYWVIATNRITEEDKTNSFIWCPSWKCFIDFKWRIRWSFSKKGNLLSALFKISGYKNNYLLNKK